MFFKTNVHGYMEQSLGPFKDSWQNYKLEVIDKSPPQLCLFCGSNKQEWGAKVEAVHPNHAIRVPMFDAHMCVSCQRRNGLLW